MQRCNCMNMHIPTYAHTRSFSNNKSEQSSFRSFYAQTCLNLYKQKMKKDEE